MISQEEPVQFLVRIININKMLTFLKNLDVNTMILAFCALAWGWQQYKQGASKISSDTIIAYQAQASINEKTLTNQAAQINSLNAEVGRLGGIIQEKDKQLGDYKEIFQGKNPQLEEILIKLVNFMEKVDTRLSNIEKPTTTASVTTTTIKT